MVLILIGLAGLAALFAPDFPFGLDPLLLLLGFAALRVEAHRLPALVLILAFLRGCATLDPAWVQVVLAGAGTGLLVLLRRRFFGARMRNQWWMTLLLAVVVQGGAILPLAAAYGHARGEILLPAAAVPAVVTAAAAPLVYWILERAILRPRWLRRGLLPTTGG